MTSFVTMSRRHRKETTSIAELEKRLIFLYSRVNSRSDPAIQALIARTTARWKRPPSRSNPPPWWPHNTKGDNNETNQN